MGTDFIVQMYFIWLPTKMLVVSISVKMALYQLNCSNSSISCRINTQYTILCTRSRAKSISSLAHLCFKSVMNKSSSEE